MYFGTFCPGWFLGFDALIELLFVLVAGLIAWYAYRTYSFTGIHRYQWWSYGFTALAGGYLLAALINGGLYFKLVQPTNVPFLLSLTASGSGPAVAFVFHALLLLVGFALLAQVALRVDDARVSGLLASMAVLVAVGSLRLLALYEIGVVLLLTVILVAAANRKRHWTMVAGFGLILASQITYILLPVWQSAYVTGHLLGLGGYLILLGRMIRVLRTR